MIDLKEIEKSSNWVYNGYFANNTLFRKWNELGLIYNTNGSKNSFCLKTKTTNRNNIPSLLVERFGIKDIDLFTTKYEEAISGDGQEWTRITTLHSSSLIALLCFYSISENNKLKIGDYLFHESFFEVKTQVYESSDSNMDIVLRGFDNNGNKIVLFLESKFSEYLKSGKKDNISKCAYEKTYNKLSLFDNNPIEKVEFSNTDGKICISPKYPRKEPIYCEGIKQMLSHYIGVCHYSQNRQNALVEQHPRFKADTGEKVILGEIMFDFEDNYTNKKLDNYKTAYRALAHRINSMQQVFMLENVVTYQEIFRNVVNRVIKEKTISELYNLM